MPFNQTIRNIEAKNHSQNGYYFICKFFYKNSQKYESFIVSLNKLGELKNWEKFPHQVFEHLQVADNALYLLGKTKAPIPYTGNAENAVLAKFDLDLNPIWAKIYFGENFEYAKTSLNVAKDGSLIMGYSTFGAFPVSLCKLDSTGNILWQKGYPFYEPQIDVLSDGSILMATNQHFDSTGAIFPKTIIAKTDSLGDLAGCETFESCIESFPTQIMTEDFPLQVVPNPVEFDSVGTESKPDSLQFYPFCDIPAPPSPDFSIPDSVCIGKFIKPMGLKNQLAHGIEWRFEGPYGDTTIQKTAAPKFKMTRPGRHKIAQTIWFLGCDYRTEREIVVLDSLKINIEPSGTICEDPPILLKITSNRPVSSLLWSNGTTEPSFEIFDSGIFSLTATDGFCKAGDSTALVLVKNLIGPGLLIEAGNDTIVCQKKLPFQVRPKSDFTEFFEMKGSNLPLDSTFLIPKAGVFTFSANIFGCVFEDSLRLEVDPCESNIFAPTSFSPNDDGTNDFFTLFGGPEIREIKSLKVFARWGELLFEQNNFQPNDEKMGWDGRFRGKKMPPSVVSWLAEVEFIDDETRFFEGDLTLLH